VQKQLRLRRRKDFDSVLREGRVVSHSLLVLRSLPNGLPHNRYGFITSKRLGGAVVRNRVRRRLREAVRALDTVPGWDVVLAARAAAARADFHELKSAIVNLFARAGLLADTAPDREDRP
jgi:ribonuclease P protein component